MRKFGLIGSSLAHSFSPKFFTEYFSDHKINAKYERHEISDISLISKVFSLMPDGLNVTIPYKEVVMQYLDVIDDEASQIGAVNTIAFSENKKIGFNTDASGFRQSIKPFLSSHHERALIIGTGGAAKAIAWTLQNMGIDVIYVSRSPKGKIKTFSYSELNNHMVNACKLIINCSPVGMYPNNLATIDFPYNHLSCDHLVIDLIYNPAETNFLMQAKRKGAITMNGESMLKHQALASWEIWNKITRNNMQKYG
ncbi:MAG: shikimate dehydrogenase [Bacteroidetes bacterium]|nr:shikimate dehydrogenase [Bacteroidota bacterium]